MASHRLIVVIPAYNEQGRVGDVVRDVRATLPDADILVVDDGSSDDTCQEALAAGAPVVRLPVNSGYGATLQTGFKHAVRGGYDLIAQMDSDGQHSAEFLPQMLARLEESHADVVIGSRFLDNDGHYRPSLARRAGMELFGRVASLVMRQAVSDPTSGYQVMRGPVARFFCNDVFPADYPDADILILLHRSGFRIAETGVQMKMPTGRSMHGGHRSLYYVYKMLLSILVTMLRRPVAPRR